MQGRRINIKKSDYISVKYLHQSRMAFLYLCFLVITLSFSRRDCLQCLVLSTIRAGPLCVCLPVCLSLCVCACVHVHIHSGGRT